MKEESVKLLPKSKDLTAFSVKKCKKLKLSKEVRMMFKSKSQENGKVGFQTMKFRSGNLAMKEMIFKENSVKQQTN